MKAKRLLFLLGILATLGLAVAACEKSGDSEGGYSISVSANAGGVVAEATVGGRPVAKAGAGTKITLVATSGGKLDFSKWTATGVTLTDPAANPATFIMPANDVSIVAEFGLLSTSDKGVKVGGVVWATRNVDAPGTFAAAPEARGMFYQWNRPTGWSNADPLASSPKGLDWDESESEGDIWARANDPCPTGWRVPTYVEFEMLYDETKVTATLTDTPVKAAVFTDTVSGEKLFLPYAGARQTNPQKLINVYKAGYYWTNTPGADPGTGDVGALFFYFHDGQIPVVTLSYYRAACLAVRCVADSE